MAASTVEFVDSNGYFVTVDPATIKSISRPLGAYSGEVELMTGAKWAFGGNHTMRKDYYERILAAFEQANTDRQEAQS